MANRVSTADSEHSGQPDDVLESCRGAPLRVVVDAADGAAPPARATREDTDEPAEGDADDDGQDDDVTAGIHAATAENIDDDGDAEETDGLEDAGDESMDDIDALEEPSPNAPPTWRAHDRTHLEVAIAYQARPEQRATRWVWEAYFFVPESFRINKAAYGQAQLLDDFKSYVRLALCPAKLDTLLGEPLHHLGRTLEGGDVDAAVRELRLYACRVRGAGIAAVREIEQLMPHDGAPHGKDAARDAIAHLVESSAAFSPKLGALSARFADADPRISVALQWVHEHISLVMETLLGQLATHAKQAGLPKKSVRALVARAVEESLHRHEASYPSVARADLDTREIERLEFRRHTLKRFTSSALWLGAKKYSPGRWAKHGLYLLAACVAMGFAIAAALWNGTAAPPEQLALWLGVVVVGYGIKDRIKASLQTLSLRMLSRRYPDRRWRVHPRGRNVELARVDERTGFRKFDELDASVLAARRLTRGHPMEEDARPERVLWHKKEVTVYRDRLQSEDLRYEGLMEILRVDLRRWLVHTDDAKSRIVLADPQRQRIDTVVAPRVYNIAVVYRLRQAVEDAPWHRDRIVVSRKGVRRIEKIS